MTYQNSFKQMDRIMTLNSSLLNIHCW